MTYYGMPVGTDWDEVGFAFNEPVVRGLLRGRYGYDGIVLTDWNLLEGTQMGDFVFGPNGWGLEDRSPAERLRLAFGAGVDQFGGDRCTQLVDAGHITTERLDASVRRILLETFRLGLFDQHRVDPAHALQICGSSELVARGEQAQRDALVLLKDQTDSGDRLLPLTPGTRVFGDGIDPIAGEPLGLVAVAAPQDGDVILLALSAPYEQDNAAFGIFHGGSLAFPEDVVDKVTAYSLTAPTVVVVYLERPAVLTPLTDAASVLVGQFGASDRVLCEALTTNRFDTVDPLFSHGAGGPTS